MTAHTVVRVHFHWPLDVGRVAAGAQFKLIAMMQACPVRVDLISDMLDTIYLPPRYLESLQALAGQLSAVPEFAHAGAGRLQQIVCVAVRTGSEDEPGLRSRSLIASSLEMARALIAQSRRGDIAPSGYDRWESSN